MPASVNVPRAAVKGGTGGQVSDSSTAIARPRLLALGPVTSSGPGNIHAASGIVRV